MLSNIFLGLSLVGAEWVLYLLLILSIISVSLIVERIWFYREASRGMDAFRSAVRSAIEKGQREEAYKIAQERGAGGKAASIDLESQMALVLLTEARSGKPKSETLTQLAQDAVVRGRLGWDRNLSILATIGANAPFIGLFGTVLGIIKAFHDLSQQAATGVQTVTAGISEALVATAVGLLVAIPAVIAYNLFQRKVKAAVANAEALKSFLVGKLAE